MNIITPAHNQLTAVKPQIQLAIVATAIPVPLATDLTGIAQARSKVWL